MGLAEVLANAVTRSWPTRGPKSTTFVTVGGSVWDFEEEVEEKGERLRGQSARQDYLTYRGCPVSALRRVWQRLMPLYTTLTRTFREMYRSVGADRRPEISIKK